MENRWIFLTDNYEGIEKKALNTLYGEISDRLSYVLPIKNIDEVAVGEMRESNIVLVGKLSTNSLIKKCQEKQIVQIPQKAEGYSVYVGESIFSTENQMIVVAGYDAAGILYGCMDFCNKYLGDVIFRQRDLWSPSTFENMLYNKLNPWRISTAPAIKRRAIWTWGHVIYGYRRFFENMANLRLNEIVIWNDVVPLNAEDVVNYAHSLNIKVIWGFSWGWGKSCRSILEHYEKGFSAEVKQQVIETYEREYSQIGGDGIYFQSFTELNADYVNGKCVAELVTEMVNDIADSLLGKYPDMQIQFGLHATSVKTQLKYIKNVDKRIAIVWEDCGSFPYDYHTDKIANFDETLTFTEQITTLRGENEKFGAVLKGMLKLDWEKFEHISKPYILGERSKNFINERQISKNKIWKIQQAGWLKNAEHVRQIIEMIAKEASDPVVQALVEDSMFENRIVLPVALYAEMLWNPTGNTSEMIEQVSKYPSVNFSNI